MDQSLRDAAEQGNIDDLYLLIGRDAKVLDWFDEIPFVETPLHTAAFAGHTWFAMEVMKLKPSFARKLNQDGFSPMHLALQRLHKLEENPDLRRNETHELFIKKQTQLVRRLLDVDKDLVRVRGREGVTPLHYVAQIENLYFLEKFVKACPESLEDVTIRNENVLHIALKNDKVKAFLRVIEWVQWTWLVKDASLLEKKLLRGRDEKENTLLQVAVSKVSKKNLPKVVSSLLNTKLVKIHAENLEGHTVFDILKDQTKNDKEADVINKLHPDERLNALLVVGALLITVTFQAALTPPKSRQNLFLLLNALTYCLTTTALFVLIPPGLIGYLLHELLLLLLTCFCFSTLVITTHHKIFIGLSFLFGYTFSTLFVHLMLLTIPVKKFKKFQLSLEKLFMATKKVVKARGREASPSNA